MDFDLVRSFSIAIIAIVNPLSKVPLFVDASAGQARPARRRLALYVVGVAFLVLLLALLAGRLFLNLFSVDLAAFRVGGGIVILLVGVKMIWGSAIDISTDGDEGDEPSVQAQARFREIVVPMAIPIVAGPGSISTVIVYSARAGTTLEYVGLAVVLVVVMLLVLAIFLASRQVQRAVGETSLEIVTRIFGLILAGIAVQFIAEGLGELFPVLVTPDSVLEDNGSG